MNDVKFSDNAFIGDVADVYAVVYTHSFTDAQLHYGSDKAFLNIYD